MNNYKVILIYDDTSKLLRYIYGLGVWVDYIEFAHLFIYTTQELFTGP